MVKNTIGVSPLINDTAVSQSWISRPEKSHHWQQKTKREKFISNNSHQFQPRSRTWARYEGFSPPTKLSLHYIAHSLLSGDYDTHMALHNNARWGVKANSKSQAIKLLLLYEQWVVTKDSNTVPLCLRQRATPHATHRLYADNASWKCVF